MKIQCSEGYTSKRGSTSVSISGYSQDLGNVIHEVSSMTSGSGLQGDTPSLAFIYATIGLATAGRYIFIFATIGLATAGQHVFLFATFGLKAAGRYTFFDAEFGLNAAW